MSMIGAVRTSERCPKCRGAFSSVRHPLTGDVIDLMCPACLIRPRRFYVDGRGIRDRAGVVGRLFRDRNGQPFDSFLSAHRTLEAIRREIDEHRFDSTKWAADRLREMRISRACDPWIEHLKRNRSAEYPKAQHRHLTKYVVPILGDIDVRDIRGIDVETLHAELLKLPIKENTVRAVLTALRSLLSWLHRMGVVPQVPPFPPLAPVPRAHVGWIEKEQQAKVLEGIRSDVRLLVETMMELGCRPGEAVALKVRDLRDGGLRVERAADRSRKMKPTKTGAVSWREVSPELYNRLREVTKGKLPEAWLFPNAAGKPYPPTQISWLWRQAALRAGVEVCLYVACRHSRVSQLRQELERRVSEELRTALAHTSSRTTLKHYVRDDREKGAPE